MTTKEILKSKVLWTGLATICGGIGMFFSGEQNLQELLVVVIGVVFTVLRFFTGVPLKVALKFGLMKGK